MTNMGAIMGFISVSGTARAALTWVWVIGALAASPIVASATETASELDLTVSGLRNAKGNVLICLTANAKAFPDCSKDSAAHKLKVAAANAGHVRFDSLIPGTYAVSLIHDENNNGKLDTMMMMPREGFGFSRNPAISFGPPKFGSASFAVGAGAVAQSVKMKYML
jgi:uncharacterized protein (DUF2141 family)